MRPCDIDRSDRVWLYRPAEHKTEHFGHDRIVFIGPRGQRILKPFLKRPAEQFCFSPLEAEKQRYADLGRRRKTPLSCGNRPTRNALDRGDRVLHDRYTVASYRRAIDRAIERAFPPPAPLAKRDDESEGQWQERLTPDQRAQLKAWCREHHWHPQQLRHSYGTKALKKSNFDSTRILLGHRSPDMTVVYAQRDIEQAKQVAWIIG